MALDKGTALRVWLNISDDEEWENYILGTDITKFAQAIYALGVAEERERLAKRFDEAGWHPYAELVRKGE